MLRQYYYATSHLHIKFITRRQTKETGHDTSILIGYPMIKIGWFPSIVELPYDQVRRKSSRDRWNATACLFRWLRYQSGFFSFKNKFYTRLAGNILNAAFFFFSFFLQDFKVVKINKFPIIFTDNANSRRLKSYFSSFIYTCTGRITVSFLYPQYNFYDLT